MNEEEDLKQLYSGDHVNSANSVRMHYHVNIISKIMTELVTELVKIVHFFSIATDFSVQTIWC